VELSEFTAVQAERDAILSGKPNHSYFVRKSIPYFIRSLMKLLYNPEVKANGTMVRAVMDVIAERTRLENSIPPDVKMMLRTGQAPAPQGIPSSGPELQTAQPAQPAEAQVSV